MSARTLLFATAVLLATAAAHAETYTIQHVTLIDGRGHAPRRNMSVVIENGRFGEILPTAIASAPRGKVINGTGKYLIPGIVNTHVHVRGFVPGPNTSDPALMRKADEAVLAGYLYCGVTTIVDLANRAERILPLRTDERAGKIQSPHIYASGRAITVPGGHGSDEGLLVTAWPEAEKQIREKLEKEQPDIQKIMLEEFGWGNQPLIPTLSEDMLRQVIQLVQTSGVRTIVHIKSELRAREAVFAGIDALAHIPLTGRVSDGYLKLMAARKLPVTATFAWDDFFIRSKTAPQFLDEPLYVATMDPIQRETFKKNGQTYREFSDNFRTYLQAMDPIAQDDLRRLVAAGGVVTVGTDGANPASTPREMELLAQSGIPNLEVIKAATYNGARLLAKEEEFGSIEEGKLADAVLLNADPVASINNVKNIGFVMKAGDIVDESRLVLAGGPQKRRFSIP
jgi:imidazolonepropionase-like amidohydrolase